MCSLNYVYLRNDVSTKPLIISEISNQNNRLTIIFDQDEPLDGKAVVDYRFSSVYPVQKTCFVKTDSIKMVDTVRVNQYILIEKVPT